tara:strand:+ start:852 stop:1070 length:219 start_codon:yes stop_codon:yes gene_type:complete
MTRFEEVKVGDLVKISDGTEDARLPPARTGIAIENILNESGRETYMWNIQFTNGNTLKFHEMFIEVVGQHDV